MSPTTAAFLAALLAYVALVGPGSLRRPAPVRRHRAPGLPTTRLSIPVLSFAPGAEPVWWLDLTLPVPHRASS